MWAVWIFFASTGRFGSEHTSRFIIPILRWLLPHASDATLDALHLAIRKSAHVVEYFILSVLLWRAVRGETHKWRFRWALTAVAIAGVYATSDEVHQIFVPGRTAAVHDVVIDICGATLAQFVIWFWLRKPRHETSR